MSLWRFLRGGARIIIAGPRMPHPHNEFGPHGVMNVGAGLYFDQGPAGPNGAKEGLFVFGGKVNRIVHIFERFMQNFAYLRVQEVALKA